MSTKRPPQYAPTTIGGESLVWLSVHRSTWALLPGNWLSRKIWSSAVTKRQEGVDKLAIMVVVKVALPFSQTRMLPVSRWATKTVFFLLTKRPWGILPRVILSANVIAFGFHDALRHSFGWLNDRTKMKYWVSMRSEWCKRFSFRSKKQELYYEVRCKLTASKSCQIW